MNTMAGGAENKKRKPEGRAFDHFPSAYALPIMRDIYLFHGHKCLCYTIYLFLRTLVRNHFIHGGAN